MPVRRNSTYRRELKQKLMRRGSTCYWCGKVLEWSTATIEHMIPLSRGGSNHISNCRLACKKCNEERGDKTAFDLLEEEMRASNERRDPTKAV